MPPINSNNNRLSSQTSKATVLVVDDEKIVRELCVQALREYHVVQAATCEEAVRIYKGERVDLVLSDIMMPGGSGIDLLKQIKAHDPNATVIIMTGFVDKETILKALKEDADDFINKPLNLLQLRTAIEKALGRKAVKEELASIKRSDELKSTFLSLVSHKLRTPITGISLLLQNLRMGLFSPDDPVFKQSITMADEEARYLGQLVADLLLFSQAMIGGSAINKSSCDLTDLITEVLFQCRETHCNYGVAVDFAPSTMPPLQLDAEKVRFALLQVIDNAFKFSGEQGHVDIKTVHDTDTAFIVVSDSGVGIQANEIPKLFEKFYQIDPDHTGQIRGFGLGLFYAREFIWQHGGSIDLASEPGLGTTVTISLPLQ